jgi:hypothetical protein
MMSARGDVIIMLANVSNGTNDNHEAINMFSKHLSNDHVPSEKGKNSFGGVLIAIHCS